VLTGRGADLIVIDDPLKAEEAWSDTRRRAVNDWFDMSQRSRCGEAPSPWSSPPTSRGREEKRALACRGGRDVKRGWNSLSHPPKRFTESAAARAAYFTPLLIALAYCFTSLVPWI
jgi:hypothetical protein